MIIAEVGSAHVPVEVLGLQVECEDVCQQPTECARDLRNSIAAEFEFLPCPIVKFDSFAFVHDRLVLSVRPTGQEQSNRRSMGSCFKDRDSCSPADQSAV